MSNLVKLWYFDEDGAVWVNPRCVAMVRPDVRSPDKSCGVYVDGVTCLSISGSADIIARLLNQEPHDDY